MKVTIFCKELWSPFFSQQSCAIYLALLQNTTVQISTKHVPWVPQKCRRTQTPLKDQWKSPRAFWTSQDMSGYCQLAPFGLWPFHPIQPPLQSWPGHLLQRRPERFLSSKYQQCHPQVREFCNTILKCELRVIKNRHQFGVWNYISATYLYPLGQRLSALAHGSLGKKLTLKNLRTVSVSSLVIRRMLKSVIVALEIKTQSYPS